MVQNLYFAEELSGFRQSMISQVLCDVFARMLSTRVHCMRVVPVGTLLGKTLDEISQMQFLVGTEPDNFVEFSFFELLVIATTCREWTQTLSSTIVQTYMFTRKEAVEIIRSIQFG
jgi:hypothetical protein